MARAKSDGAPSVTQRAAASPPSFRPSPQGESIPVQCVQQRCWHHRRKLVEHAYCQSAHILTGAGKQTQHSRHEHVAGTLRLATWPWRALQGRLHLHRPVLAHLQAGREYLDSMRSPTRALLGHLGCTRAPCTTRPGRPQHGSRPRSPGPLLALPPALASYPARQPWQSPPRRCRLCAAARAWGAPPWAAARRAAASAAPLAAQHTVWPGCSSAGGLRSGAPALVHTQAQQR